MGKASAQLNCGMDKAMQELYASDPQMKKDFETLVENAKAAMKDKSYDDSTIIVIPIVFHIIHQFGAENISDANVYDEMKVLNRDYAKLNPDTAAIIPQYIPYAGDAKIQFKLASIDPSGNCTNGIEHIYSHLTNNGDDYSKLNQWPRTNYLNVWVVKTIGMAGVAGYAFYPSGVEGSGYFRDGVIILSDYIGTLAPSSPYTSRALTHEIGHYLGLAHTWGNTNDPQIACGNDFVDDTPITKGHNQCNPADLYDIICSNAQFPANFMRFDSVSTTNGATNLTVKDTVWYRVQTTPFKAVGLSANSTKDSVFSFTGWGTGAANGLTDSTLLTGAIDPTKYYEVTIAAEFRHLIQLTSLSFKMNRSSTGPRTFAVRSSVDGYASNLTAIASPGDTLIKLIGASNTFFYKRDTTLAQLSSKVNLTGPSFTGLQFNQPITFRIYAWNGEDAMGSFSIDNVSFGGKAGIIENTQNYMEYAYCSNMFTNDQVTYMRTVLQSITSSRNNLWTNTNHTITGTDVTAPPLCTPKADFHPSSRFACQGTPVTFTDFSWRAAITNRSWTFEGGTPSTSTAANPVVTFTGAGWHKATLTVSNANGSDIESVDQSVFITTYNDIQGPYVENFDGQSASWWISDNPEEDYTKFELVSSAGYDGSSCMRLKNYKNTTGAQEWQDDYYYTQRLGDATDNLISPNFDLSNTSGVGLTFKYAYASNAATSTDITEALSIYVSKDCGLTWQFRKKITGTDLLTAGTGWVDYVPNDQVQWKTGSATVVTSSADKNVRFKFEFKSSDFSNNLYIDDVNITGTLGIANNPLIDMGVNVYPNPVTSGSQLTVNYTANGNPMTIELMDMTGRLVYKGENKQTTGEVVQTIDVASTLAPGVYSFRISDGNYFLDKKVVIQ